MCASAARAALLLVLASAVGADNPAAAAAASSAPAIDTFCRALVQSVGCDHPLGAASASLSVRDSCPGACTSVSSSSHVATASDPAEEPEGDYCCGEECCPEPGDSGHDGVRAGARRLLGHDDPDADQPGGSPCTVGENEGEGFESLSVKFVEEPHGHVEAQEEPEEVSLTIEYHKGGKDGTCCGAQPDHHCKAKLYHDGNITVKSANATSCLEQLEITKLQFKPKNSAIVVTLKEKQTLTLAHCADEDEDEEEEEELESTPKFSNVLCLTIVGLVALTIFFETAKDFLTKAAGEEIKELVSSLFGELTILGFIGLCSFLCVNFGYSSKLSVAIFMEGKDKCGAEPPSGLEGGHNHTAGEECWETDEYNERKSLFTETLEKLHMTIFGVMVVFIAQILFLVKIGHHSIALWKKCEEELDEAMAKEEKRRVNGPNGFQSHRQELNERYHRQNKNGHHLPDLTPLHVTDFGMTRFLLRFDRLKLRFTRHAYEEGKVPKAAKPKWAGSIDWKGVFGCAETDQTYRHRWIPDAFENFNFANYLQRWQHEVLRELVEVTSTTWAFVVVMTGVLRIVLTLHTEERIVAYIVFGYTLLVAAIGIRRKMAGIMHDITPDWPPPQKNSHRSGGAAGQEPLLSIQGPSQTRTQNDDWYKNPADPDSHPGKTLYCPEDKQPLYKGRKIEVHDTTWFGNKVQKTLHSHHTLFWRLPCKFLRYLERKEGLEEHGVDFTLQLIEIVMLMNAMYTAVFVIWVCPALFEEHFMYGHLLTVAVIIVGLLAPILTMTVALPRALFDFVMSTCLESHIDKETIHDVLLEQKKEMVSLIFQTIGHARKMAAVAQNLQDPAAMARTIAECKARNTAAFTCRCHRFAEFMHDLDDVKTEETLITEESFISMVKHAHGMEEVPEAILRQLFVVIGRGNGVEDIDPATGNVCIQLVEFLDFADAYLAEKSLKAEVKELFELMDTDAEFDDQSAEGGGDGTITAAEFKGFMKKHVADSGISEEDLDEIMREIDDDNQGTISEEELFEFLKKLED